MPNQDQLTHTNFNGDSGFLKIEMDFEKGKGARMSNQSKKMSAKLTIKEPVAEPVEENEPVESDNELVERRRKRNWRK